MTNKFLPRTKGWFRKNLTGYIFVQFLSDESTYSKFFKHFWTALFVLILKKSLILFLAEHGPEILQTLRREQKENFIYNKYLFVKALYHWVSCTYLVYQC